MKKNESHSKTKTATTKNTPPPGGELHPIADQDHPPLTTHQGVRISDNQNSLKAIAFNPGGKSLLKAANSGEDAEAVITADLDAFLAAAKTWQWNRKKRARMPA